MGKKRANGEGTIRYRTDNRWEGRIIIGHKSDGKPIYKSVTGKTQKEVTLKLRNLISDYEGASITEDQNMTISEWLDTWYEQYVCTNLRKTTASNYQRKIAKIKKVIGDKMIKKVTTTDIQRMYNYLKQYGSNNNGVLADSTVRGIHMLLHEAMDVAVKAHMIVKNPTDNTTVPKPNYKGIQVFDEKQLNIFIDAIEKEPLWYDFFYTEITTGLRKGEICGLRWEDINFETGIIKISHALSVVDGEIIFGETKTDNGHRIFKLPHKTRLLLERRKQYAVTEWVFPSFRNPDQALSPSTAYHKFKDILRNAELPSIRFHDLRHTFATHAIMVGVDEKTLSRLLGHENASFTLDTYTHVTNDMSKQAATVVDGFLKNILGKEMKPWQ